MHGPYLEQNRPPYFLLLYHTAVYGVEVAVHVENDSACVLFAPSLIDVDITKFIQ